MNSENWQRRELIGATYSNAIVTRYYGYSNVPNAADTDAVFAIKKVGVSGQVETVSWNDNSFLNYNAKWSERAANFTAPTGALGFTYSGTSPITFTWTRLAGVNSYNIVVKNQNGNLVDKTGGVYFNTTDKTVTTTYFNQTTHNQILTQSGTYSVVLQAVNAAGILTATYSYTVS